MNSDASHNDYIEAGAAQGLSSGTIVNNKYKVIGLLGSGGMGKVYRVQQIALGKEFAMKVLDVRNQSEMTVRRFHQEARTTSQLQHPNLVEVHDFGVLGDTQPYLVMDLIEGESLAQVLKQQGALPVDFVIPLAIQVGFALMYAHEKGVVHRDVKPGNIMLLQADSPAAEGTVKVVDFGIAKLTQSEDGEIQALTRTGEIFGSPAYMSPEQCKGTGVDKRSDIYSFGCVLFEALTGSPPFFGDSAMSTMMKRLSEAPVSLKEGSFGREFPPALERIVARMLAVEPGERYQDFGAVVQDLIALKNTDGRNDGIAASTEDQRSLQSGKIRPKSIALIMVAACAATMILDCLVLLPTQAQYELATIRAAKALAKVQESIDESKKFSHQMKEEFREQDGEPASVLATTSGNQPASNVAANKKDVSNKRYPYVVSRNTASGIKKYLVFPKYIGKFFKLTDNGRFDAKGEYELPPDAQLVFILDKSVSPDPNVFENIADLNFAKIDYNNNFLVNDHSISTLRKISNLMALGLRETDIQSLAPLYDNKTLASLELLGTSVTETELLKLKRLGALRNLTFGPSRNPEIVFEQLAKTNNIFILGYKGMSGSQPTRTRADLDREISALQRLTSLHGLCIYNYPDFDDACLVKLLSLKNLTAIDIRDCGLTGKSAATLIKFPKLKELKLTKKNWSREQIATLKAKGMQVMFTIPQSERSRNSAQTLDPGKLIPLELED